MKRHHQKQMQSSASTYDALQSLVVKKFQEENEKLKEELKACKEIISILRKEVEEAKEEKFSELEKTAKSIAVQAMQKAIKELMPRKDVNCAAVTCKTESCSNTPVSSDMVELANGSGIYIKKVEQNFVLASSQLNFTTAQAKAAEWQAKQKIILSSSHGERTKKRKKDGTPPIYASSGELYLGPYDPCRMIRKLLRVLYSVEELSHMSARGTRVSNGIPANTLNAILQFVNRYCPEAVLTTRHISNTINETCCYARKKIKRNSSKDATAIKVEIDCESDSEDSSSDLS